MSELERDREMLLEIEEWLSVPLSEYAAHLKEEMGVAWVDQFEAAQSETRSLLDLFGKMNPTLTGDSFQSRLIATRMTAAILRCTKNHCEHSLGGTVPILAFPSARVMACDDCVYDFTEQLEEANRSRSSWVCDLCLQPASGYRPTITALGPARVFADVCDECWKEMW